MCFLYLPDIHKRNQNRNTLRIIKRRIDTECCSIRRIQECSNPIWKICPNIICVYVPWSMLFLVQRRRHSCCAMNRIPPCFLNFISNNSVLNGSNSFSMFFTSRYHSIYKILIHIWCHSRKLPNRSSNGSKRLNLGT